MTVRLLCAYGIYPANAIVTLDAGTEAGLIAAKMADGNLSGGTAYVAPPAPAPRANDGLYVLNAAGTRYVGRVEPDGTVTSIDPSSVAITGGTITDTAVASVSAGKRLLRASTWTRERRQFSYTDTTFTGIFWPCVIKASAYLASPIDAYYCYVSSDHDVGAGGIGLLTGPSPTGPWSWQGQVYIDSAGTQTETPSVIWDEDNQRLVMFYQQLAARYGPANVNAAIGQQSTLMCYSTDGVTWTKDPNFIHDVPSLTSQHGDGHTGYFWPFLTKNGWNACSLYGGTTEYDMVLWKPSTTGKLSAPWKTDGRALGYQLQMTQGAPLNARDVMMMGVVQSGGVEYAICRLFDGTATGANPANGVVAVATVSDDYRQITCRPVPIWTPSGSESTDLRSVTWLVDNGRVYVYFALGKQTVECVSHVL